MKYIIQPGIQIGNPEIRNIHVLTPEEVNEYRENGFTCKECAYQLIFYGIGYEVTCIEIWQKGNKEHSLIIPAFLLPHRIYPVYVYAFAINQYSSRPQLGQRKVAKETREKFGLKTFAHTTVGRAMKALAETLTQATAIDTEATEDTEQETVQNKANTGAIQQGRFPSVRDTSTIREIVMSFFSEKLKSHCQEWFSVACDYIAIYWYIHFERLLMNTAPVIGRKLSFVIQNT